MKVLSLFDGMACGMLAMLDAGVQVDSYTAYEVDKYAVKTATHNFPQIEEKGDVFEADFTQYEGVDFLVGGSPCFTKGHMVLTDKGYKDVSEIVVGDMALTHTGEYHKVVRTNQREAETQEVRAIGYAPMVTTPEHPFLTVKRRKATYAEYKEIHSWRVFSADKKWTPAEGLTKDHFVGMRIPRYEKDEDTSNLDLETLYILGRYVADGHIRKTKREGRKNSYQYQLVLSIGKGKEDAFKSHINHRHYSFYPHTKGSSRAVFSSMDLVNFVLDNGFGQGAANKAIPEFIFQLPLIKRRAFLKGYLSGDGCFVKVSGTWSASTVSKKLALGLQRLATSIYGTNAGVTVSDNDRPHEIEGREIKSNYPLYTVIFKTCRHPLDKSYVWDDIMWTQVKSTKPTGKTETVYNIEVEGDHSYTVDNCIVHNCTYWSIAQTQNRETTASGLGWELFSQYVRALKEAKPRFFIYENNKSMAKAIRDSIRETFGFEEICINSALVSAQNRQRFYWVGMRQEDGAYKKVDVRQPEDLGILLKDVLDGAVSDRNKSCCVRANKATIGLPGDWLKSRYTIVAEPVKELTEKEMDYMVREVKDGRNHFDFDYGNKSYEDKAHTVTANMAKGVPYNVLCERVGTFPGATHPEQDSKQYRIYSTEAKATTQCGQGGGLEAKTGLYAIPVEWDGNGIPTKAVSGADGKTYTVYTVADGQITIKDKQYPIKLVDGFYIIRKLTVSECKRLQTVPDWYDFSCVSATQAYKMLGNGWTVKVISHLIRACMVEEMLS